MAVQPGQFGNAQPGLHGQQQQRPVPSGPKGIRVNAISPGFVLSPAMKGMIERGEKDTDVIIEDSAIGRLLDPREIATAVAFLGSEAASAITGINLPVDGGWLAAAPWHTYGGKETSRLQTQDAYGSDAVS